MPDPSYRPFRAEQKGIGAILKGNTMAIRIAVFLVMAAVFLLLVQMFTKGKSTGPIIATQDSTEVVDTAQ